MKEMLNEYEKVEVVFEAIVLTKKNGGQSVWPFNTEEDAKKALEFARFCQYAGIALRVDRKIMAKKITR